MSKKFYSVKINLSAIDTKRAFIGKKGEYISLNLVLSDELDTYGNNGFLVQETTPEERQKGVKLPICGNLKERKTSGNVPTNLPVQNMVQPSQSSQLSQNTFDPNDLPF
jgi:hypothetical protein